MSSILTDAYDFSMLMPSPKPLGPLRVATILDTISPISDAIATTLNPGTHTIGIMVDTIDAILRTVDAIFANS